MGTMVAHSAGLLPSPLDLPFSPAVPVPAAAAGSQPASAPSSRQPPAVAYPTDTFYTFECKPGGGAANTNLQFYLQRFRVPADASFDTLWLHATGACFYRLLQTRSLPADDIRELAMATLRFACDQRGDADCPLLRNTPEMLLTRIKILFEAAGKGATVQHGMVFVGKVRFQPPPRVLAALKVVPPEASATRLVAPPGAPAPRRSLARRDRRHCPPAGRPPRPWMLPDRLALAGRKQRRAS
mmetsp:Transcript_44158/g.111755  ORF Transcript_44158/g.111755 Transcript_44158/m.111755 type:complete len:241 (+) Transcript_44158:289-1011(+)